MRKNMVERGRWQYNMAQALCMLENYGYRHRLRIRNSYCFSTISYLRLQVGGLSCTFYPKVLCRIQSTCHETS
jgi:hypothetical protein